MADMTIQELVTLIINQGFAVAVAFYSLTRLEKSLREVTQVLTQIATVINKDTKE